MMRRTVFPKIFIAALALAGCATPRPPVPRIYAGAAGPETMLLMSSVRGIDLKPDELLDGTRVLKLETGQRVTLITNTGQIITLRGPYDASPALDIRENEGIVEFIGGVRANPPFPSYQDIKIHFPPQRAPEPWLVDVSEGGSFDACLIAGAEQIDFWLDSPAKVGGGVLYPADYHWRAKLQWPPGASRHSIPTKRLELIEGSRFEINLGNFYRRIAFHLIPATASNDAMRAAWMIEHGCEDQALVLIQRLLAAKP